MKTLFFFITFILFSTEAIALDIEKLFMPGNVISGHAKYETECSNCHAILDDMSKKEMCLDCHKSIQQDIATKKGFHGLNDRLINIDCRDCHTDHKGRDANIVWLDSDRFDHRLADFMLSGRHIQAECKSCHKSDLKYRDTPGICIDCHKEDDEHKTQMGKDCKSCHNSKTWKTTQFDHDTTKYKLTDSHKKVSCNLCHLDNKYKDSPKQCVSCHAIKDVHGKRFGQKCENCHEEDKWNKNTFNHDKDTRYSIKGKHRQIDCRSCHQPDYQSKRDNLAIKKNRTCSDCHQLDDIHKESNGPKCEKCHDQKTWAENKFEHDIKTEFPLYGAHKKANCNSCHQHRKKGEKTDKRCYSCHQYEDVHKGQQGKVCNDCHNDKSWWMENVRFDHELTSYPLIGQHAVKACESCHLTSAFKDTDSKCVKCHQDQDVHEEALGNDCENCHNPNDWLIWTFEHDKSDFRLIGAHENIHCHSCHNKPLTKNNSSSDSCVDCHKREDVHDGNFGTYCGDCHTQINFKDIQINNIKK